MPAELQLPGKGGAWVKVGVGLALEGPRREGRTKGAALAAQS